MHTLWPRYLCFPHTIPSVLHAHCIYTTALDGVCTGWGCTCSSRVTASVRTECSCTTCKVPAQRMAWRVPAQRSRVLLLHYADCCSHLLELFSLEIREETSNTTKSPSTHCPLPAAYCYQRLIAHCVHRTPSCTLLLLTCVRAHPGAIESARAHSLPAAPSPACSPPPTDHLSGSPQSVRPAHHVVVSQL